MARFLFVTWGGAGNQTPAIGLAAALADRGHAVVFAGYPEQQHRFEQLGYEFHELPRAQHAWPTVPPDDWMPVLVDAVWACPQHLEDVPELIAAERCDALVVDCLMFGALAAAERVPVPTAVLVHSAPGALVPPGGGLEQLALGQVNAVRAKAGLAEVATLWDTWRPFTALCTSIRDLDPLASHIPADFAYVGPIFEPHMPATWPWPWRDDDRPLVLVSFSTGQAWDQASRIRRTVAALADGGHRVLVTTGLADLDGMTVPADTVLLPFLPHAEVLPHAAVTVTHAGHGTVAASLAHGVPLVGLPNLAADQPALAAQIARLGAGRALDGNTATPDEIADAVHAVLSDGRYADTARRLADVIDAMPGVDGAVEVLESLASPG